MSVRGNYMTNDGLGEHFKEGLVHLHAKVDALPPGLRRRMLRGLAKAAHVALEAIARDVESNGGFETFSVGGDDKEDPAP